MKVQQFGVATVADRLVELADAGRLRYLGVPERNGPLCVEVGGRRRELHPALMVSWLRGWLAADGAQLAPAPDLTVLADVKRLLVHPAYEDQLRIRARWLMEQSGVGIMAHARNMCVTKKTLEEALRLLRPGGYLAMFVSLGDEPRVNHGMAAAGPDSPVTAVPPEGWQEPLLLRRMRAVAYAHQTGVVAWAPPERLGTVASTSNPPPFQLRLYRAGRLDGEAHEVPAAEAPLWVAGAADALNPPVADDLYSSTVTLDALRANG